MTDRSLIDASLKDRLANLVKKHCPAPSSTSDAPVQKPTLADIGGMREARLWGEALARDLADYAAGKISWDEIDRGAILYGPPGTGKTMFVMALAETCGVRLIATSFANWIDNGDGCLGDVISAIKRDFNEASPGPCILFIDELDSLPTRKSGQRGDDWWASVVNAILTEMGGIAGVHGVIVIAACNHFSKLDPALLRAGRLEKHIPVSLPTLDDLPGVIRFHLSSDEARRLGDLKPIAVMCQGMTPADVGRLVREARRNARTWKHSLRPKDFLAALESGTRDAAQDWRVAIHEAGHAVAGLSLGAAKEIHVSIVGVKGSLGVSAIEYLPVVITQKVVFDHLTILLSGRAAEQIILGEVGAGSGGDEQSDLARANRLAWQAVTEMGFSKRSPLRWCGTALSPEFRLAENAISKEVDELLACAYEASLTLVSENRGRIEAVATALVDARALTCSAIRKVMSNVPGSHSS